MPNNALFDMLAGKGMQPLEFDNRTDAQKYADALRRLYSVSAEGNQDYAGGRIGTSIPVGHGVSFMAGSRFGMSPDSQFRPELEGRDIGVSYSGGGLNLRASRSIDEATKQAMYRLMLSKSF
jgi:hypothetical protein